MNSQIADAYTQGTVTNGTAYGGGGGSLNGANQNCTNGAIVAIGTTKSGDNLNSFMFVCKTINNNASLSATEVTTNVFGTPSESDRCSTGQIGIGVRVIASNGGSLVGGVGLICGNPMSQGNPNTRSIMPDALSTGTVYTFTCPTGQLLAGFALRTGSLVDQITPKCSTFTSFAYAAVGAPTATVTGNSASVSFTSVPGSIADTALTYTVSAVPNIGSTITVTGSASPLTVPGLVLRANYTITVTASNAYGASPSTSSTSAAVAIPGGDTDTALAITGTQYAWVADTGTGGVFDIPGSISVQAWVYPTESTASTQYSVITKAESFQLFHIDGIWKYALAGASAWGAGISTGISVRLNEWHHVAFTRQSGTNIVNFYLDGFMVYTGTANGAGSGSISDNSNPFSIGAMVYSGPTPSFRFKGKIDQVAIFDSVRTASNIKSDMHTYLSPGTSGLRASYDFNEGSGTSLINRASTSNLLSDLTLVNSVTWDDVKIESTVSAHTTVTFPRTYLTSSGGWRVPSGVSQINAVVVGGGGGGNGETDFTGWLSGGGGAGGYRYFISAISAGSTQVVKVGQGGRRGLDVASQNLNTEIPTNGEDTTFLNVTSSGGGYGGGRSLNGALGNNGGSGGSGGGGGTYSGAGGLGTAGQGNNGGLSGPSCCAGGGGGGAGGGGGNTSGTTGGNAGDGVLNPLYINGVSQQYLAGGGAGGGSAVNGSAGSLGGVAWKTTAAAATGSGGGGGGGGATHYPGGFGGSGVVIVKYLIASSKPVFSGPFNDTTTAGLVETFTVTGTPNSPLVRSYQWQVSTDTGTSWSIPTQGTGINSASYVTPILTTSISGSRYQYRVIVTDSDTAGLSMTETSSAVFLIINSALQLSGITTISKAINVAKSETFTVTGGTQTLQYTLSPTISGITLDTSTANSPVIRVSESKTVGTFYETLTVTDSVSATTFIALTINVIAPPSLSASSEQVINGVILDLDPGSSASYLGSGTTWSDLAGRGANANLNHAFGTSAPYADGSTRTGVFSNVTCGGANYNAENFGSFEFSSVGQCIYATNSIPVAVVNPLPVYTVSTWIKRNGTQAAWRSINCNPYRISGDQIIFCLFWANGTQLNAGVFNGGTWYQTTAVTVPDQTWVYATVTYNGSNLLNLYLNDTATAYFTNSVSVTWSSSKINTGLIIGRKWDAADTFIGSVGQIRIYDRILSSAEIAQNFNATKGRYLNTFNKRSLSKKYGVSISDTYTVTSGADSIATTLSLNNQIAIKWDTSTARSTRLNLLETLTVGTYNETITVTDSLGQSVYLPLSFTVTKADTITVTASAATTQVFNNAPASSLPVFGITGLVATDAATIVRRYTGVDWSKTCAQGGGCEVGDTGPGGGTIFYISPTAINAATGISSGGTYLEVAPRNWWGTNSETSTAWSTVSTSVTGTLNTVGSGAENTRLINTALGSTSVAAKLAADLTFNGKSDWFLPSTLEVKEMYEALYAPGLSGNLAVLNYWASTQGSNAGQADTYWFGNGGLVSTTNKVQSYAVRPIRAYSPDTITVTTVPTNVDSYTVTVETVTMTSGLLSNYENVIFQKSGLDITKARQDSLRPTAYVGNFGTPYTLTILGGSGTGAVTESITAGSSATGCSLTNHVISSSTAGSCVVQLKKAYSRNYFTETSTAFIYLMQWSINQPTGQTGGGTTIGVNGNTAIIRDPNAAPTITSLSTYTAQAGVTQIVISGAGFNSLDIANIVVKFWRNKIATSFTINAGNSEITVTVPVGATTGKVTVTTPNGIAVSELPLMITS